MREKQIVALKKAFFEQLNRMAEQIFQKNRLLIESFEGDPQDVYSGGLFTQSGDSDSNMNRGTGYTEEMFNEELNKRIEKILEQINKQHKIAMKQLELQVQRLRNDLKNQELYYKDEIAKLEDKHREEIEKIKEEMNNEIKQLMKRIIEFDA